MKKWYVSSALVFALAACAGDSEPQPAKPPAKIRGVAPTEAELATYRAELSKTLSHTVKAQKATDSNVRALSLEGYGNVALAKITAEGNVAHACVDDVDEGVNFLADVNTGAGGLEEK